MAKRASRLRFVATVASGAMRVRTASVVVNVPAAMQGLAGSQSRDNNRRPRTIITTIPPTTVGRPSKPRERNEGGPLTRTATTAAKGRSPLASKRKAAAQGKADRSRSPFAKLAALKEQMKVGHDGKTQPQSGSRQRISISSCFLPAWRSRGRIAQDLIPLESRPGQLAIRFHSSVPR